MGEEVTLYTYLHVTETGLDLFGFYDQSELSCFKMLLGVTRVGPKAALSILSGITAEQFALAVASGDAKTLSHAPGLGMKTAQRIVLELKDKISKETAAQGIALPDIPVFSQSSNASEAINALVVLGYTQGEAAAVVTKLPQEMSVEDMIKKSLQTLAGLA
jgi:Holliday junction DNA helicase RuvA